MDKLKIKADGEKFTFEPEENIKTDYLKSFDFKDSSKQLITIETNEFSAVCPFSGLPDIAHVKIEYYPVHQKCVELKSLKYYFVSFRNVGIYQEKVTQRIHKDLRLLLSTNLLKVTTKYNTRGGFETTCSEGTIQI